MKEKLINVEIDNFKSSELPVDYIDTDIVLIETMANFSATVVGVKFNFNFIVSCFEGEASFTIAGKEYTIGAGQTMMCPSGTIMSRPQATPNLKVSILGVTDRLVQSILHDNIDVWNKALYSNSVHIATRPPQSTEIATHFSALLRVLIEWRDHPFREQMVRSMLQLIILSICAYFMRTEEKENGSVEIAEKSPQGRILFNKFMELLKNENIKHRPIYYYSDKLCITPKYLSYVCKEMSGKTANEFIQLAVMTDVDYYLLHTTMSVKEVAHLLGFPTLSFFGKYVKSHVGLSPNDYRKKFSKG